MILKVGGYQRRISDFELVAGLTAILTITAIYTFSYYHFYYKSRAMDGLDEYAYNRVGLAINYIEFGAVRRGLVGSIIYLSGMPLTYAMFTLYGVSLFLFLALSFFLLRKITIPAIGLIPFLLIALALQLYWSMDVGKPDILVAVILIAATLALVEAQIVLASVLIAIGTLVHEECAAFGLPLLFVLLADQGRYRQFTARALRWSGAVLALGALVYVATLIGAHRSNNEIVSRIISEHPSINLNNLFVQLALYADLGGPRAVKSSICAIDGFNHYAQLLISFMLIVLTLYSLSGIRFGRWLVPLVASVPAMLFLWMTGADMARWTALGILSVWIVCAVQKFAPEAATLDRSVWARAAVAAVMIALIFPRTVYVQSHNLYPSPLIEGALEMATGRPQYRTQDDCDPNWRSALSQTGS